MVIMGSGIACGCVHTTVTAAVESRNMVAILQITGWQRHAALLAVYFFDIGQQQQQQQNFIDQKYK